MMMMSPWAPIKVVLVVAIGLLAVVWATSAIGKNLDKIRTEICKSVAGSDSAACGQRVVEEGCPVDLEGAPCGGRREGCLSSGPHGCCPGGRVDCCSETIRERWVRTTNREICYDECGRRIHCRENIREEYRLDIRRDCCSHSWGCCGHHVGCCGCGRGARCPPGGNSTSNPPTKPQANTGEPPPPPPSERICRDGTFGEWHAQELDRVQRSMTMAYARSEHSEQQRGRRPHGLAERTIRVLTLPYFSRNPIMYELRMDENGKARLSTMWFPDDNHWLWFRPTNAHRIMRHRGQHAAWRWEPLRSETRQLTLNPDDAWRLWAIAGEINRGSPYRKSPDDCMEEGNWLVINGLLGRNQLHIAPLRGFDRQIDRNRYESDERGFDADVVSDRDLIRNNAETRFFCALAEMARTPQRVLVRGDAADVCHNMIRDPPLLENDDGPDPYDRSGPRRD